MSNKPLLAWLTILAVSGCDKKPAAEPAVSSDSETALNEAPGAANESEATVLGSEGDPDEIPGAPRPLPSAAQSACSRKPLACWAR